MLVLSRKLEEKIVIAGEITITVIELDRGKVRLGIHAPRGVTIDRMEIHLEKLAKEAALQALRQGKPVPFAPPLSNSLNRGET
jgi:carbon storage regulator